MLLDSDVEGNRPEDRELTARLYGGDSRVRIRQGAGDATLAVMLDAALPDGTVRIARGVPETAMLGEGEMSVEKIQEAAVA